VAETSEVIETLGVRLSNPDKVLYPEQGITKRDLADYYAAIADWLLPHVVRRPITLVRCPAGRQKKCFYQRHAGSGVPSELNQIEIAGFEESGAYLYVKSIKGVIALVQMGVLEIHPWNAHVDRPDRPDQMIFDLDPGEGLGFADAVMAAHDVRDALSGAGLVSFAKTTGGKGIHVMVPIERRHEWRDVKLFAKRLADELAAGAPDRYLTRISKAERRGRTFIDYLRNDPTSTAVAPYSTRARQGAPVSTPLTWDELTASTDPAGFNIKTVPRRLEKLDRDPWVGIGSLRQRLPG
jgi:bifunctional non-homologous end joining protein LigD